jgi:hypothetical protein
MNLKDNLHTYMKNFPGSFMGFFNTVSEILSDVGEEWIDYANETENPKYKEWGSVFLEASKSVKNISGSLRKIYTEYEKHMVEKEEPANLIQDFKDKVAGIKNGKRT